MLDNDIIKALECCKNTVAEDMCNDCPLSEQEDKTCITILCDKTLDLINRLEKTNRKNERIIELADKTIETQKAEIERLNVELVGMRGAANSYKMHYDKSQAENKELWEERNRIYESLKETKADLEEYRKGYTDAQAEIERLQNTLDDVLDREPVLVERSEKYAKAEAINEFAEEFEKRCISGGIYPAFVKRQLNDVKKEMTENDFKE